MSLCSDKGDFALFVLVNTSCDPDEPFVAEGLVLSLWMWSLHSQSNKSIPSSENKFVGLDRWSTNVSIPAGVLRPWRRRRGELIQQQWLWGGGVWLPRPAERVGWPEKHRQHLLHEFRDSGLEQLTAPHWILPWMWQYGATQYIALENRTVKELPSADQRTLAQQTARLCCTKWNHSRNKRNPPDVSRLSTTRHTRVSTMFHGSAPRRVEGDDAATAWIYIAPSWRRNARRVSMPVAFVTIRGWVWDLW